jgi:hypothetical protein
MSLEEVREFVPKLAGADTQGPRRCAGQRGGGAVKRVPLYAMAHARSGDKGDGSNVGILAYDRRGYEILVDWLTPERVREHFGEIVRGEVERFELPNLLGLNFLLGDSLGGSGSASLKTDAQGKTHGMALLRIEVEVPDDYEPPKVGAEGAVAPNGELSPDHA